MTGVSARSKVRPSAVHYDARERLWAIDLASSTYAFVSPEDGAPPRNLHWGAAAPVDALLRAARSSGDLYRARRVTHADDETPEYGVAGDLHFEEPGLVAEYPDGTRAVQWHVSGHEVVREGDAVLLTVRLADDRHPLVAHLCYGAFDGHDVLERWVELEHTGGEGPVVVRAARSAEWWIPGTGRRTVRYLHGGWGRETQLVENVLAPGKLVLESRRGLTGHHLNPWFTVSATGAVTEESGAVWSGELAWSGSWKIVLESTPAGRLHVVGGWNEFDAPLLLAPGARLGLPVFAGSWSSEGFGGSRRGWHAYQREHVLASEQRSGRSPSFPSRPVRGGRPVGPRPVLYNSWEATEFAVDLDQQLRLAERAARVGAEMFVLDDGWFAGRRDDTAGLGDWTPDPGKFPKGLGPLADGVHSLGMRFGVWMEPEMVNPDSSLYREHPDWVFHFENRRRSTWRNQLVLNLARPDVADWLFQAVDTVLSDGDVDFVKWDMNRALSETGWPEEVGRNPERAWMEHVEALYRILERLRRAHPEVAFESCASGGGRADLGMLARVEQVWTSDDTDAWDRVAIQEGFAEAYAPVAMMNWVTDSPNPLTGRRLPLSYRFHVAMGGSLGIGADLEAWGEDEIAEASHHVAVYKQIRRTVAVGSHHRLERSSDGGISATQYVAPDRSEVVVIAAWGVRRFAAHPSRIPLVALAPDEHYEDADTGELRSGADLMAIGVDLPGSLDYGSLCARFRRVPGAP